MLRRITHTLTIAIIALAITACTPAPKAKRPVKKKAPNTTMLLLEKGQYEDAAKRMASMDWKKFVSASERLNIYPRAVNGLIGKGDMRLKSNEYASAGAEYRKAIRYYPSEAPIANKVRRTKKELNESIGVCSKALMESALLKYRAGQLEDAISIWASIISFDPGNVEAKKALDTATIQLQNLKKLNGK